MLFSRWHVSNEPTPDFSSSAWQSLRLFPGLSDKSGEAEESAFDQLFEEAISGITKDRLEGTKVMSDAGYFYADAFGLVRPTISGIKSLDGVDVINANTLLPEILSVLVRANAGYPADHRMESKAPKRFAVMPSQALQKEVFPWLKPLLIGAFGQNSNNDDVRSATRFLRVLRELRVVLLQDAAFFMEMPYLKRVIEGSPFFEHTLFTSSEFKAFRQEMRNAVGETEIHELEQVCTIAVRWVSERRKKLPDGSAERMIPTAPRLLNPSAYSVAASASTIAKPGQHSTAVESEAERQEADMPRTNSSALLLSQTGIAEEERKRAREPTVAAETNGSENSGENGTDYNDPDGFPKRSRRVYDLLSSGPSYRIYGDASTAPPAPSERSTIGSPTRAVSESLTNALDTLRMENDDLKAHVRRLEWMLNQHKAEVQTWMSKMEKNMQSFSSASRQSSPLPREVSAGQTQRASIPPLMNSLSSSRPPATVVGAQSGASAGYSARQPSYQSHMSTHYPQQQQQQLPLQSQTPRSVYSDSHYQQSSASGMHGHGHGHNQGMHEPIGRYERQVNGVKSGHPHQQVPIQPSSRPVSQQHYSQHPEYRGNMRIPLSPRGQAYGQHASAAELVDYRAPQQQPGGPTYMDQGWYPGSRDDSAYASGHQSPVHPNVPRSNY
ncbi:hypothetical protein BX070DRAFT_227549 [Coemansia spiralis]|nr:hypothetical protein BX070DRAFT_227549 [Coemansia spiralis]